MGVELSSRALNKSQDKRELLSQRSERTINEFSEKEISTGFYVSNIWCHLYKVVWSNKTIDIEIDRNLNEINTNVGTWRYAGKRTNSEAI